MIDEQRALGHAPERAIARQRDRCQIIIITNAADHRIGATRGLCRAGRDLATMRSDPFFGARHRPVIDRHFVSGLDQMARHRAAHHPESDKCNSCHGLCIRRVSCQRQMR